MTTPTPEPADFTLGFHRLSNEAVEAHRRTAYDYAFPPREKSLCPARLAEIRTRELPDYEQAPEFAIRDVSDLLAHVVALEAKLAAAQPLKSLVVDAVHDLRNGLVLHQSGTAWVQLTRARTLLTAVLKHPLATEVKQPETPDPEPLAALKAIRHVLRFVTSHDDVLTLRNRLRVLADHVLNPTKETK